MTLQEAEVKRSSRGQRERRFFLGGGLLIIGLSCNLPAVGQPASANRNAAPGPKQTLQTVTLIQRSLSLTAARRSCETCFLSNILHVSLLPPKRQKRKNTSIHRYKLGDVSANSAASTNFLMRYSSSERTLKPYLHGNNAVDVSAAV